MTGLGLKKHRQQAKSHSIYYDQQSEKKIQSFGLAGILTSKVIQ